LALLPTKPADKPDQPDSGKPDAQQDVLLREVDEAVRQEEMLGIVRNYGVPIAAAVVLGLAALGGYLYWQHYQRQQAGELAERYTVAMDRLDAGAAEDARKELAGLAGDTSGAAKASAQLSQAAILLGQGKKPEAIKGFAAVAADAALPKPYRDLALVREIATGFDALPPQQVIDRLKPLAVPGNPWFGSAGELVGLAYLKQDKPQLAGAMFAAIAKDKGVPKLVASRARQLAGQLGVDAVDELIKTASDAAEDEAKAPARPAAAGPAGAPAAAPQ
jgi:hypothetical protein